MLHNFGSTESRFICALNDVFRRKKSISQFRNVSERQPKRHLLNNPNVARGKRQVRRVWCFGDVMRERIGQLGPKQTSLLRIACNTGGETKDVREKQVAALGKLPPEPAVQNAHPDIAGIDRDGALAL